MKVNAGYERSDADLQSVEAIQRVCDEADAAKYIADRVYEKLEAICPEVRMEYNRLNPDGPTFEAVAEGIIKDTQEYAMRILHLRNELRLLARL